MRISDWSSDVCSSDLRCVRVAERVTERATNLPRSGGEWNRQAVRLPPFSRLLQDNGENHVSFMTRTRRLAAGMVLGSVVVAATISLAQSPAFFRIGTGGTSGTYYPIGGLIANAISGNENRGVPGIVATAVS